MPHDHARDEHGEHRPVARLHRGSCTVAPDAPSAELAKLAPGGGISGIDILRLLSPVFMGHNRNTHISRNMRMHMCYADLHGATNRYRLVPYGTNKRHALASGGAPLHGHGAHGHGHGACAFPPAPFSSGHPSIGARRRARSRLLSAACLRFTFRLGVEPLVRVRVSVMARVRLKLWLGLGLG